MFFFPSRNKKNKRKKRKEKETKMDSDSSLLPPLTVSYGETSSDSVPAVQEESSISDSSSSASADSESPQQIDISEKIKEQKLNQYNNAVEEIERRKLALAANCNSSSSNSSTESTAVAVNIQFQSHQGYRFALMNKANRFMRPSCKRPAFRLLGFFRNNEELEEYIEELKSSGCIDPQDGSCKLGDIHKVPIITHYTLISKSISRDRNEQYVISKINEIKKLHMEHHRMADEEFRQNREEKKAGKTGLSIEKKREKAKEKRKKSSREAAIKEKAASLASTTAAAAPSLIGRVPRAMEFREQNYAIIIMLEDITKPVLKGQDDPEPVILLLDAFESKEEAQKYLDTLSHYVFYMSMYIVDMYQWLFPEDLDAKQIEEQYRNPEQNLIMKTKKEKDLEVKKYKEDVESKKNNALEDHSSSVAVDTSTTVTAAAAAISADPMFTESNHLLPSQTTTSSSGPIVSGNEPMKVTIIDEPISQAELERLTDTARDVTISSVAGSVTSAETAKAFQDRLKTCS
jgi:hypothetical protein